MNEKEKHVRENEPHNAEELGHSLEAEGKNRKRENTHKINRLWMWLGVILLIFILFYWLFTIGIFEDILAVFNG